MNAGPKLIVNSETIAGFCRKHHICKLSLFGSALRGELRADSDVDLLVEFEPGHTAGYFKLAAMERELAAILGRKADLRTPEELNVRFRDEVVRTAKQIYAA